MPDEVKEVTMTMEELAKFMREAMEGMTRDQIAAIKATMEETQRKTIFPSGEDGVYQTGKSVVDTSFFTKDYNVGRFAGGGAKDANSLGYAMRAAGGPFLHLSPIMQKFAEIVRRGADGQKCAAAGISIAEYNTEVAEVNAKILGEKAMASAEVGVIIPVEYMATVIEFAVAQSAILPKLWRISMASNTLRIPKLVQEAGNYFGGITLYHPGEGGLKVESKPSFDSMTLTAKKLIGLIGLTDELVADSAINIVNYITGLFVRAFQWQTEYEVINGTGQNYQMLGILNDAINEVPRKTVGQIHYDDLVELDSSLDENFNNLTVLTRRATSNSLRKLKDSQGAYVYHEGVSGLFAGAVMPPQLMANPVIKTRNVPVLGSRGDVILGDLGFYLWAVRQDMTIDTSRDYRFQYDETTLRFVVRQDGLPAVPIAFAVLDDSTS